MLTSVKPPLKGLRYVKPLTSRLRRSPRTTVAVAFVAVLTGLTAFAYANFVDTDSANRAVTAGQVSLSVNDGVNRFSIDIDRLAPGVSDQRVVHLVNNGTVPLYGAGPNDPPNGIGLQLSTSDPSNSDLTSDWSNGLQVELDVCDVAWTENVLGDGRYDYTCSGTETAVTNLPTPILGTFDLPFSIFASYQPGGTDHLRATITLASSAPTEYVDLSTTVNFDFLGIQRDGVIK